MTLKNLELLLAFLLLYGRMLEAKAIYPIVEAAHQNNYLGVYYSFKKLGYSTKEAWNLTKELWKTI